MNMEDQRRIWISKRVKHDASSPLGYRYSNAVCQIEAMEHLKKSHAQTLREIDELEFQAIL